MAGKRTENNARRSRAIALACAGAGAVVACSPQGARAATLNWDPGLTGGALGGGSGTWDTSTTNWFNGSTDVAWPNNTTTDPALTAAFGGTAGTVTLGATGLQVNTLSFNTTGYTLAAATTSSSIALGGTTPGVSIGSGISAAINELITGSRLTVSGGGNLSLGNLTNVTNTFQGLTVNSGTTVTYTTTQANIFGNSSNTVQLNSGTITAGANGINLPQSIVVSGNSTINLNSNGTTILNDTSARTLTGATGTTLNVIGGAQLTIGSNSGGAMSGFAGSVVLGSNVQVRLSGVNRGSAAAAWDLGASGNLRERDGANLSYDLGSLTGQSGSVLQGAQTGGSTTATTSFTTWSIGALGTNTTFAGKIQNGSANIGTSSTQSLPTTSIIKTGTGSLALTNSGSSYAGSTTINNGTLSVSSLPNGGVSLSTTSSASGSTTVTVTDASHLAVGQSVYGTFIPENNGGGTTITGITGNTVTLSSATNGAGTANTLFGPLSSIGISPNSASSLVINGGTFQYTGGATSTDRLFTVGTNGATLDASGSGAVNFTSTGSVAFATPNTTPRTLMLTGTNTGQNTLSPVIADAGGSGGLTSLTKAGGGTWVLASANTYTGVTTIQGGTLALGASGSIANSSKIIVGDSVANNSAIFDVSAVSGGFTLGATQTLAGHGFVNGSVSTSSGSHLAPGNSAGVTTYNNNLTQVSGTNLDFDLNTPNAAGGAANGNDQILVEGTATLATGEILNVTPGGSVGAGNYYLIDSPNAIAPVDFTTWTVNGLPGNVTGYSLAVATDPFNGNEPSVVLTLSSSATPEPGSLALAGLGAAGLLLRRRRQRAPLA